MTFFTTAANTINHPFHLHGYPLFVMSMGQNIDQSPMTVAMARTLSSIRGFSKPTTRKHPIKDTIAIPSKGYTVFRFKADNPGWWLLHCHYGTKHLLFIEP
jgi:FtsP/CotA-like multicopper oxidase with cupredoxin domain